MAGFSLFKHSNIAQHSTSALSRRIRQHIMRLLIGYVSAGIALILITQFFIATQRKITLPIATSTISAGTAITKKNYTLTQVPYHAMLEQINYEIPQNAIAQISISKHSIIMQSMFSTLPPLPENHIAHEVQLASAPHRILPNNYVSLITNTQCDVVGLNSSATLNTSEPHIRRSETHEVQHLEQCIIAKHVLVLDTPTIHSGSHAPTLIVAITPQTALQLIRIQEHIPIIALKENDKD
ncbi:MAG: hypothetical protein Q3961_01660 [Bifidobacteriaceae bacterium]|nr:hypothetical protein [Bifidobacteriaceae bacterium]